MSCKEMKESSLPKFDISSKRSIKRKTPIQKLFSVSNKQKRKITKSIQRALVRPCLISVPCSPYKKKSSSKKRNLNAISEHVVFLHPSYNASQIQKTWYDTVKEYDHSTRTKNKDLMGLFGDIGPCDPKRRAKSSPKTKNSTFSLQKAKSENFIKFQPGKLFEAQGLGTQSGEFTKRYLDITKEGRRNHIFKGHRTKSIKGKPLMLFRRTLKSRKSMTKQAERIKTKIYKLQKLFAASSRGQPERRTPLGPPSIREANTKGLEEISS
ncbi:unnamed protein product [Moneuplotes crassus]|uniref:Uncharacterized protein n=1 Tax=Euplotes crassus TaxID=5936 RepID=A0AAD1XEK9_EUPCR|nr:unnamed protein product [Moneuplotes crassus]